MYSMYDSEYPLIVKIPSIEKVTIDQFCDQKAYSYLKVILVPPVAHFSWAIHVQLHIHPLPFVKRRYRTALQFETVVNIPSMALRIQLVTQRSRRREWVFVPLYLGVVQKLNLVIMLRARRPTTVCRKCLHLILFASDTGGVRTV
jgi:hypothetical protein